MTGVHRLCVDGTDVGAVTLADSYLRRLRGLLGRVRVPRPLLLIPCSSVHGVGMVIPLDVALLDRDGVVVHVSTLWPFGLVLPRKGAHSALETARGDLARLGIRPGTRVTTGPPAELGPRLGPQAHGNGGSRT